MEWHRPDRNDNERRRLERSLHAMQCAVGCDSTALDVMSAFLSRSRIEMGYVWGPSRRDDGDSWKPLFLSLLLARRNSPEMIPIASSSARCSNYYAVVYVVTGRSHQGQALTRNAATKAEILHLHSIATNKTG